jgi:hypothetical protein
MPVRKQSHADTHGYIPAGENYNLWRQKLRDSSQRIFQVDGGGAEVLRTSRDGTNALDVLAEPASLTTARDAEKCTQKCFMTSDDIQAYGLQQYLQGGSWSQVAFIIRPAFSWGHLTITESAFQTMLDRLRLFTPFLRIIYSFGQKTNDKDRARDIAYYRVHPSSTYGL